MEQNHHYFMLRAQEERAAAKRSATPEARRAHLQLSARYEEMANTVLVEHVGRWKRFWQKRSVS